MDIIVGTELKINVNVEPFGDTHLEDCYFECIFYVKKSRAQLIKKEDMIRQDKDNYVALVDSAKLGPGRLLLKISVYVPDMDFGDANRKEVDLLWTGVTLIDA